MNELGWVCLLVCLALLGLPVLAYLIAKFGTAGHLQAKRLFRRDYNDNHQPEDDCNANP